MWVFLFVWMCGFAAFMTIPVNEAAEGEDYNFAPKWKIIIAILLYATFWPISFYSVQKEKKNWKASNHA